MKTASAWHVALGYTWQQRAGQVTDGNICYGANLCNSQVKLYTTHFVPWAWWGPTRRTLVGMKTFPWLVELLRGQVRKSGKTSNFLLINSSARLTELQLQNTFIVFCAFAATTVWSYTGVHTWISWISDWSVAASKQTSFLACGSFQHGCQEKNPDAPWWRHRLTSSLRFVDFSNLNIF